MRGVCDRCDANHTSCPNCACKDCWRKLTCKGEYECLEDLYKIEGD